MLIQKNGFQLKTRRSTKHVTPIKHLICFNGGDDLVLLHILAHLKDANMTKGRWPWTTRLLGSLLGKQGELSVYIVRCSCNYLESCTMCIYIHMSVSIYVYAHIMYT